MVRAVDDRHVDGGAAKRTGSEQPAEARADDHDAMTRRLGSESGARVIGAYGRCGEGGSVGRSSGGVVATSSRRGAPPLNAGLPTVAAHALIRRVRLRRARGSALAATRPPVVKASELHGEGRSFAEGSLASWPEAR